MASKSDEVRLLEDIRKLLILQLEHQGATSKSIADVLGVDPAVISRLVPRHKK